MSKYDLPKLKQGLIEMEQIYELEKKKSGMIYRYSQNGMCGDYLLRFMQRIINSRRELIEELESKAQKRRE